MFADEILQDALLLIHYTNIRSGHFELMKCFDARLLYLHVRMRIGIVCENSTDCW